MTAVDLVPGARLPGVGSGEFQAQPRARRLAKRVLVVVLILGAVTIWRVSRRLGSPLAEIALGVALMAQGIAIMGYLVRRARLLVHSAGVRWGWDGVGFTMHKSELEAIHLYSDAVALTPRRGSTWYVSTADWDRFEDFPERLRLADLPLTSHAGRAPFQARMQSYGRVLNGLLILNVGIAALALALAVLA